MLEKARLRVVGEVGEPAVDDAPQAGAVVAGPVQDGQDVGDPVAGGQVGLHAAVEGGAVVAAQLLHLFRRVRPQVAAGHHPEDVVVVEGEVPLHVAGAALADVLGVAHDRGAVAGGEVPVPARRAVIAHRAAHEHHLGHGGVLDPEEPAADALHVLVEPDLDGAGGGGVDLAGHT